MARKITVLDEIEGDLSEEIAENAESGKKVSQEPDESEAGPEKEETIPEGAPAAGTSPEEPSDEVSDSQIQDYLYGKKGKGKKKRRFRDEDNPDGDDGDDDGEGDDDGDGEGEGSDGTDDDGEGGGDDDETPNGDEDCRNRKSKKGKKGKGRLKNGPMTVMNEIEGDLSEEIADEPEKAGDIDEPEENDVKPDEAGDNRPNAGSDEAGTTPEEPSDEVTDSQIEDMLENGCSGGKKRKNKKHKGARNEDGGSDDDDDDDSGDDNPDNPDDADAQAAAEHPDDDDPDNEGSDDDGDGDDDDDSTPSEDKKKKNKKKSRKGLTNWDKWRAELEESNPTTPDGLDTDRPDGFDQQDDEAKPNTPPELTEPIEKEVEGNNPDDEGDDINPEIPDSTITNILKTSW